MKKTLDTCYEQVIELAKEIGLYQKSFFRSKAFSVATKSSSVDMVTEVDVACDQKIVKAIQKWFPDDAILSEEQGYKEGTSAYTWIVDPLDGTTNFSIGLPIFAVSIARWQGETPEFGVVYVPMLDELFVAQSGRGAYHNGQKIKASNKKHLAQSVLATGFPYDRATAANNNSENIQKMIPLVKGIRRMGAAAYDLCLVGAGIFDGFWELRLGKWDLAAAKLVILEAGGVFYAHEDKGKYNVLCGSPEICAAIDEVVNLNNG